MPKITDLTAATSVGATDVIPIVQSGTTKKLTATTLTGWAKTAAETSAGVTPSSLAYPPADARRYGGVTTNSDSDITANNAAIQSAITSLGDRGGVVTVPAGCRFQLSALTLPQRCNIQHFKDDDRSTETAEAYYGGLGTNEQVNFIANANVDGIVNEERIESTYHPGHIINVRKNLTTQDAYLGGSQSRLAPARASYNIQNEGMEWFRILAEQYADSRSAFSGVSITAFCPRITLTGILTASYTAGTPALYTKITGNTSGATGYYLSSDGTATIVAWVSGKFVTGETVNYGTTKDTTATITALTPSNLSGQSLWFDNVSGAVAVGLPPGTVPKTFGVGGDVVITPTRSASQRIPEGSTSDPTLWLTTSLEAATIYGWGIAYDTTPAAVNRRLRLRKWGETTMRGQVGAVQAKCSFSNSALIETSALNVATIARTATGKYTVTLTTELVTADYAILIGNSNVADRSVWKNKAVGSFEIWNYNTSDALADLTSEVSVLCACGDI